MEKSINIKIGGKAGEGIKTTGLILSKTLSRLGFSIFSYDEYPSLIRGGHNTYQVYASSEPVRSQHKDLDLLISYDAQTLDLHKNELKSGALVIFDPEVFEPEGQFQFIPVPLSKIAQEKTGSELSANIVSLGATLALLNLSVEVLEEVIRDVFVGKGEELIASNCQAARAGFARVEALEKLGGLGLKKSSRVSEQIVVLGNEAIGVAAISSGLKYFSSYPMTPATALFHFLAINALSHNLIVHHAENEIAAINSIIGASAAGIRVMTTTSGGGFSLMAEGLGMAGIAEVPAVIVLGMRPGPATGLPTWTGQGDLRFAIHASQDEFPRVVLAPGDAFEAFTLTRKAFELAEKYQLPVIILVDKYLCESHKSGPAFDAQQTNAQFGFTHKIGEEFKRYQLVTSGVSPRPILGQSGGSSILANSYEHGEDSLGSEEASTRVEQMEKRLGKLKSLSADLGDLPVFGSEKAAVTLVGFGSTLGPALEALKELSNVNYLHFNYLWPFPPSAEKILEEAGQIICLEGNAQGQLQGLIREHTGVNIGECLRKFDGRPFYPEEIIEKVKSYGAKD